jgi:hypothetical protein
MGSCVPHPNPLPLEGEGDATATGEGGTRMTRSILLSGNETGRDRDELRDLLLQFRRNL